MKTASNIMAVPLNFEELLFTNKNKSYGSYILRKSYKKHLMFSTFIVIIFYSFAATWPLMHQATEKIQNPLGKKTTTLEIFPLPPVDHINQFEPPVEVIPLRNTIKFTPPVVSPDVNVRNEVFPDIDKLKAADPWTKTEEGSNKGVDITLLEVKEPGTNVEVENMKQIYTWVEEMPHFPGGEESLYHFILSHVIYPEIAKRAGIQGKVITSFTIEKNGSITNLKTEKGIGAGCDEEAIRVISLLGKWEPGKQNGSPVRVRMMIPINFKLQ